MEFAIAVAWHKLEQIWAFMAAWGLVDRSSTPTIDRLIEACPPWLVLQQDINRDGGAKTKNKAMRRAADLGAGMIVSLDDDCFPSVAGQTLEQFAHQHALALDMQPVRMFEVVTDPPSRGTPFETLDLRMPVAASMGFWTEIGDYCGPRQLVHGGSCPSPMTFHPQTVFGRYFPLCAMNYAFRPRDWAPFFYLVEGVGRFDDIWMGWMWQRAAYARGYCFNLGGPLVRHVRQSNVWRNLRTEALRIEDSETLWRSIAVCEPSYEAMRLLIAPLIGGDGSDYAAPRSGP